MTRSLLLLVLAIGVVRADDPKVNPFAPSLPALSEEQEKKIDAVIDRFILYDIGQLRGAEGQQAVKDFNRLGPESIPALIRGLNRAAAINHSCPVTVIATKLNKLLMSSDDIKLMQYARDEIGSGIGPSVHRAILQDLRFAVTQRQNALRRAGVTTPRPAIVVRTLSTSQLLEDAGKEKGEKLKAVLGELGSRDGDGIISTLGIHAASYDRDVQTAARNALHNALLRLKPDELKKKLTDEKAEVRLGAVKLVHQRGLRWGSELIDRLDDDDANVRQWARSSLGKLAQNDFGPGPNATKEERRRSMERWSEWWKRQGGR